MITVLLTPKKERDSIAKLAEFLVPSLIKSASNYKNLCQVTIVMRINSPNAIGKTGYHTGEKPGVSRRITPKPIKANWPVRLAVQRLGCGA